MQSILIMIIMKKAPKTLSINNIMQDVMNNDNQYTNIMLKIMISIYNIVQNILIYYALYNNINSMHDALWTVKTNIINIIMPDILTHQDQCRNHHEKCYEKV